MYINHSFCASKIQVITSPPSHKVIVKVSTLLLVKEKLYYSLHRACHLCLCRILVPELEVTSSSCINLFRPLISERRLRGRVSLPSYSLAIHIID
jgi:hypothetical protein